MGRACGTYERQERCTQSFGGETCGKEPYKGPRGRWEDNIKMGFKKRDGVVEWIDLAQDRDR